VPHLRDSLIVAKVGHFRGSENPDTPKLAHAAMARTIPGKVRPLDHFPLSKSHTAQSRETGPAKNKVEKSGIFLAAD
jgi:hypothetical protein